jgi:ABC-type amino acid transport substrate-binding protein
MLKATGRIVTAVITIAAIYAMSASAARAADKYIFVVPMTSNSIGVGGAGKSPSGDNSSAFLKRLCEIISKKTGDAVECVVIIKPSDALLTPANTKKYIKQIEDKKYAALYISGPDYYAMLATGYNKAVPGVMISFKRKTTDQACLYTRASDVFNSVEELKGKTWAGSYFYTGTRFILYKNGIDMPLKKFFGQTFVVMDDYWTNMADMLLAGKVDVFSGSMEEEMMGRARDKKYAQVKTLVCTTHRSTHMLIFNKTAMSEEKMEQIRKMLLNAHKDKDFGTFQFIFTIINGHFVPFDEESFKYSKEFVDTSEKRGWVKEQFNFVAGK